MVPDFTTNSKSFQGIGDTSVGDQLLHESSVQSPLDWSHPDEEDMLRLCGERVLENDVAPPLDKALQLLVQDVRPVLHQSHVLGGGVATLSWAQQLLL